MIWWISIVSYLWRNSLRRWLEQPLGVLSKGVIAALMGLLGAVMILGSSFLGEELAAQLASRDALTVRTSEAVPGSLANAMLGAEDPEEQGWRGLGEDVVVMMLPLTQAQLESGREVSLVALRDPEAHGYPDTPVYLGTGAREGSTVVVGIGNDRFEALALPLRPELARALPERDVVLASVARMAPLLQGGFSRQVVFKAHSIRELERAHEIAELMQAVEGRRVFMQSALPILRQLERIREVQGFVLLGVTLGSALVLGLVCGALAWMEFREERYLLALIRSFGVGRLTLLVHAVLENCLLAVAGVLAGFGLLGLVAGQLDLAALNMTWLAEQDVLWRGDGLWLVLGAACGGLLSCIPIGIGLRRPLGLVLK